MRHALAVLFALTSLVPAVASACELLLDPNPSAAAIVAEIERLGADPVAFGQLKRQGRGNLLVALQQLKWDRLDDLVTQHRFAPQNLTVRAVYQHLGQNESPSARADESLAPILNQLWSLFRQDRHFAADMAALDVASRSNRPTGAALAEEPLFRDLLAGMDRATVRRMGTATEAAPVEPRYEDFDLLWERYVTHSVKAVAISGVGVARATASLRLKFLPPALHVNAGSTYDVELIKALDQRPEIRLATWDYFDDRKAHMHVPGADLYYLTDRPADPGNTERLANSLTEIFDHHPNGGLIRIVVAHQPDQPIRFTPPEWMVVEDVIYAKNRDDLALFSVFRIQPTTLRHNEVTTVDPSGPYTVVRWPWRLWR
jgi:hypothetical protein